MVWPLLAMGGLSVLQQMQAGKADAKASIADNKAIREANAKNYQSTLFRSGLLNLQRGQDKMMLQQRRYDVGKDLNSALGTNAVNAAASGTVGASVDAVQTDIEMQFEQAKSQISLENEQNAENFNTQLHDLILNGQNAQISARKYKGQSMGSMLLTAGAQVGMQYAGAKMNLGLGS